MNLFQSKSVLSNSGDIVKESWLTKQSKYRKVWRDRWCVLTLDKLYTFQKEKEYSNPTEEIEISKIKTVKSDENSSTHIFKIELINSTFYFQAKSLEDKEAWIGAIGKMMVKSSSSKIFIPEDEN